MSQKENSKSVLSPKVTLDRIGQLIFTFREVSRITARVSKKLLILVFVLNAISGFIILPGLYLEKLILDKLIEGIGAPDWRLALYTVGILVILKLLIELLRSVISRLTSFLRRVLSRLFEAELDMLMAKKLSMLDMATIENPSFKDKFDKIERESGRRAWALMMPISDLPNSLAGFLSSVGLLVFLSPLIAVGVVLVSLPQFLVDSKFIRKEYELNSKLAPLHRLWGWLSYYLIRNKNFMELKVLDLSTHLSDKLKKVQGEVLGKYVDLRKKRELSNFGSLLPLTLLEFFVSLWLIFWVITQKITVGSFQMYLRAFRSAQSNLSDIVSSVLEIYENYIYVSDLVWFLNLEPIIEKEEKGKVLDSKKSYSFSLKDVWFKYRRGNPWILKNISLSVSPGERIAIVGENGAGKSTLIKIIARFYDPQKGVVLVDGENLRDLKLTSWRKSLAILFQKFETYPFTARESIGYGDIERLEKVDEIKESAKRTGIDDFIISLPKKYENPLAPEFEKGVDLSMGQWQRLGISRMLFRRQADIIIMDEPTSNVDPKAEEEIFNELLKETKGKILIFVSQRFSTVRKADKIYVMDRGRFVEAGTHDELMDKKGLYYELFTLQAKGYK